MTRLLLLVGAPLFLAACGNTPSCTGKDAESALGHAFHDGIARVMARDYMNVEAAKRAAVNLISPAFSGISESGRDDENHTCTGEAIVNVTLDPAVARQLKDPAAAQWLPSVLGDVTVAGDTLRDKVEFTLSRNNDGTTAATVPGFDDVVSASVTLTMQRAAASAVGAR